MKDLLNQHILDNRIEDLLWFLGIVLIVFILKRYLSDILGRLLYRIFRRFTKENEVKHFNELLLRPVSIFLVLITIFFSFKLLHYPSTWDFQIMELDMKHFLFKLTIISLTLTFTWIILRITDFISYVMYQRAAKNESMMDEQLVPFVKDLLKVVIVIFSLFFILGGILKFNINSLLAGLGIGGLAVALAAQESLANLFGSFAIFLDRPFTVGDEVKVGAVQGIVEKVGFRSTRLRTLDKTFVTVPNKMVVDSFVDNLTLRTYLHVTATVGLSYNTKPEQLRGIIKDLQQYFDSQEQMKGGANSVLFNNFGEYSINVAIEYFVSRNYQDAFSKIKEEVNFKIMEVVYKNGTTFAHIRIVENKTSANTES